MLSIWLVVKQTLLAHACLYCVLNDVVVCHYNCTHTHTHTAIVWCVRCGVNVNTTSHSLVERAMFEMSNRSRARHSICACQIWIWWICYESDIHHIQEYALIISWLSNEFLRIWFWLIGSFLFPFQPFFVCFRSFPPYPRSSYTVACGVGKLPGNREFNSKSIPRISPFLVRLTLAPTQTKKKKLAIRYINKETA